MKKLNNVAWRRHIITRLFGRRVGGCDLWPFVGWISLEIGGEKAGLPLLPGVCTVLQDDQFVALKERENFWNFS